MFKFLSEKFEEEFQRPLHLWKILLDCEAAAFQAVKQIWPSARVQLCRVHCLRNWRKTAIKYFGKSVFEENETLKLGVCT